MKNNELFEKSLKYVPGGVHSPVRSFKGLHTTPRFIEKAQGANIWDVEGKKYIDFCMSFGPMILGHRHPQVEEAIISAVRDGWSFGACERYSLELAEFIVERIPFIEQIRFMNSGTEAVMTAIRLARGYTAKNKIIKFNGCYHGHSDAMLIKAGSGLAGTAEASSKGVTEENAKDTLICELGNLEEAKQIFETHKDDIAAVFIEPLPANNGLLIQDESLLQGLRDLCTKYNSLLVFDEVISGFRASFGGMSEVLGITPDLVTYGKIIGGGMPVGAVAGKKEIMSHLAPLGGVYQAGTLSANPVAMRAGLANLKLLTPDNFEKIEENTNRIVALFRKWFAETEFKDYHIVQYKSLFWQVPTTDKIQDIGKIPQNINDRFKTLFEVLLNKGIYLSPNAYEISFGSIAHDEKVAKEIENLLWN